MNKNTYNFAKPNEDGKKLRKIIKTQLMHSHYSYVKPNDFEALFSQNKPIWTFKKTIGKTIYGNKYVATFILYHPTKHPKCLIIQPKWQQSAGSICRIYPYLISNIQFNKIPTIIVADGGGISKKAIEWTKNQINVFNSWLLGVFNLVEFQTWINNSNI